ncbi:MAG: porin [Vicinamibacterales bacterium]
MTHLQTDGVRGRILRLTRRILATAFGIAGFAADANAQPGSRTEPVQEDKDRGSLEYSWKDGETTFRFATGKVTLSNRLQLLWTDERHESREAERSFDVPRARTKAAGWIYSEHLSYRFELDWAEGPVLEDLFLSWNASRTGAFEIQVGQFKVPFGRQRLTSSGAQQFVDRAVVSRDFTKGRDIGLQVKGLLAEKRMEYRVGVFNGAGQNTLSDDGRLQYNGRVVLQPFGEVKYSEGDLDDAEAPLLAIAGNFEIHDRRGVAAGDGREHVIVATDVAFYYRGFSLLGELFLRTLSHETEATLRSNGFLVQGGYLVVPRRLEIAGRLAMSDPTALTATDGQREVGLAVGYFVNGHNLKLQSDLRRLDDRRGEHTEHELRVQLQVVF